MLFNDADDDTGSEELNVETAAPVFERFLSEMEKKDKPETPPTQPTPESAQPETPDVEASSEPAEGDEGESAETEKPEDEQDETPAEDTIDPTVMVRVKIDGVEQQVTLEEALKGYSRTQDYTRKTQSHAENVRAFQAEAEAVRSERQAYATQMAQLEQVFRDTTPQEPDWAQVQRDTPDEFPALWAQWSAHEKRMGEVAFERNRAEQAVARDQAATRQKYLQAEQEKLLEAIPDWRNSETATAGKTKMVAYVKEKGYTVEEIAQITDHRVIELIDKAMRWDDSQKKKPAIQQRIEKVKVATPGPASGASKKPVPEAQKARERLAKTGRQEDAAAVFATLLGD